MPSAGRLSFLAARRALLLRLAGTGYVAVAALRAENGQGFRAWGLGAAALAMSAVSARRAKRASSLAIWGGSVALASLGTSARSAWIDALGIVGVLVANVCACAALGEAAATPPESKALLPRRDRSPALAMGAVAVVWTLALGVTVAAALETSAWCQENMQTCAAVAAVAAAAILIGACERTLRDRALVLGMGDRMRVARSGSALLFVMAAAVGVTEPESIDRVLRLGVVASSTLVAVVALHGDAVRIVRLWRRAVALAVVGGPVALLAAMAVGGPPWNGSSVVFVATLVALLIGSAGPYLESPLRPMEGIWLDAVDKARAALARADTESALREALSALRAPAGPQASSPELWTLDPVVIHTIDAAGYPRDRASELPESLLAIAAAEPCAMLRTEVLEALEVRRPDLRSLLRWMSDRGALSATVIALAGEPRGLLLLPRGNRTQPVTLEEAQAIKSLADVLAGACDAKSALARSMARERAASLRAEAAEERVLALEQDEARGKGRHTLATSRVARPATVGVYSAASRLALEALERRTRTGAPLAVIAPSGVDPLPYLARAHLGGSRRATPFAIVDGTSSREHDLSRWTDPLASPLALADRGMLVLLDGACLPLDIQRLVAQALAERRAPWERPEPLDVVLALTATVSPLSLLEAGRLDHALATRLADALDEPVLLPRLSDRGEDIRAILTDRLAREGLRVRGEPFGLDDAAFARLADYPFPGEEAELASIVQRLIARMQGNVVRAKDIDALGLPPIEGSAADSTDGAFRNDSEPRSAHRRARGDGN